MLHAGKDGVSREGRKVEEGVLETYRVGANAGRAEVRNGGGDGLAGL